MDKNIIYNEDCLITMNRFEDKSIDGIITSPPYNINTERSDCYYNNGYSELDGLSENDYLEVRVKEFQEFSRVINDTGVICYNISYAKENPILPTLLVAKVHNETDLTISDIICWKKPNAIPFQTSPTKLSRITELIYIFVKKKNLHTFKTNKEISKVNKKTGQKFFKNYVNYIEAKNNDGYKSQLKASFSQDLVNQIIHIYFPKGSLIYEPFTGIGTTQLSCIENECDFIGSEITDIHYNIALEKNKRKIKIFEMNKCICFKHPTDILVENQKYTMSPVFKKIKKGDVFFYIENYEGTELFNFPSRMELYDIKDGRHLFSIAQNSFHKFFLDLEKYRENQIDHILDGVV